jgi:anti-anti-sigma factor
MTIDERIVGDVVVLTLRGSFTEDADVEFGVKRHFLEKKGYTKFVLDMGAVPNLDSRGLSALSDIRRRASRSGGVKLLYLSKRVVDVLYITKQLDTYDIFDDETEAIASFSV